MNSVQQQREHHHQKVLIESFHSSGHTVVAHDSSGFRHQFQIRLELESVSMSNVSAESLSFYALEESYHTFGHKE